MMFLYVAFEALPILLEKVTSHSYDYEALLQFFAPDLLQQCLLVQGLQGLARYVSCKKHVNNNCNTFFGTDSPLQSASRCQCQNNNYIS